MQSTDERSAPRVLVVDDDRAVLNLLAEALEDEGLQVIVAATGEEGLARVERLRLAVDVILLDLLLPDMRGDQFLRQCRELAGCRHAIVILITAADQATIPSAELDEMGVAVTMSKPLDVERVVRLVLRLVNFKDRG